VLPQEIEELEEKISRIENTLSTDTELYVRDADRFDELTATLEELKALKEEKENLWLEIEIKAEEFEN